jgi:hypothetical protein
LTGKDWIHAPPEAPKHLDDTDDVMYQLALKKIDAFAGIGHGFYFWNFRTDLYEPQWSYMAALDRGWIPKGNLNDKSVQNACVREDDNTYKCVLKKGQIDKTIRGAVEYIFKTNNSTTAKERQAVLSLAGTDLENAARPLIEEFFEDHRLAGVTCDFGGIAMLLEQNRTLSDDDTVYMNDDEYLHFYDEDKILPLWVLILGGVGFMLAGILAGFSVAMHTSKKFNKNIRSSSLFTPLELSKNNFVRKFAALPTVEDDEEFEALLAGKDDA